MEDVITAVPPPSRFFLEDLNNLTPPSPPLPPPFLLFSTPNPSKPICPHFSSLPFHLHLSISSTTDKSCNVYALNDDDNSVVIVSVQYPIAAERSHAVAKLLIGEQIVPEKVLILDSVQSRNFRGKLSPDETFAFKLETSQQRKGLGDGFGDSLLLKHVDYFPSGSVVDGLSAALLSRCQVKKIKGILYLSWPEFGSSVASLVKSLLVKDVLPGLEHYLDGEGEDAHSRFGRTTDHLLNYELYT
ncbi:hypothetical protein Acr_13g0015820 [Actinidia rufa]|uniref:Proteasome assembly chaperone 1 n=1 Tax=Actinidia rufa TaxID=165716 RepID=A0A7J0FN83_9ERIC|nr:hypothetical protein Acr_13g0015820 [Actinidia rufa]